MTFTEDLIIHWVGMVTLVSFRVFGALLAMPLFAFKAINMRLKIFLALAIALLLSPMILPKDPVFAGGVDTMMGATIELAIGACAGYLIRIGMLAFDVLAETLSMLAGFSFATAYARDPNVSSGLVGEFLHLTVIAMAFAMNLHVAFLDLILKSFKAIPFGQWPDAWNAQMVVDIVIQSFQLGMVLTLPSVVIYLVFNMMQAILSRTSPQLNLFSVGFAVTIPIAFVLLAIFLPDLPVAVQRAFQGPLLYMRQGLLP